MAIALSNGVSFFDIDFRLTDQSAMAPLAGGQRRWWQESSPIDDGTQRLKLRKEGSP